MLVLWLAFLAAMPILPAPALDLRLTLPEVQQLDNAILASVTTGLRTCAACGATAFGFEPQVANYCTKPRQPGVNDRALVLSPIVRDLAVVDENRVRLCKSCRERDTASKLPKFVPTMTPEYALALASTPASDLHAFSFINVHFKLNPRSFGYTTGEFNGHSMLHAPLLVGQPARPTPAALARRQFIWDTLVEHNSLYQRFTPLRYRDGARPLELGPDAWEHIVAPHTNRDPVNDRVPDGDHPAHRTGALDIVGAVDVHADVVRGDFGDVDVGTGAAPTRVIADASSVLYKDGLAYVGGEQHSVEHLLCPYNHPHADGFYSRPKTGMGAHFLPRPYLRHRTRQAFTPFTKQTAPLLLLRSIENCRSAVADMAGRKTVNRAAFCRLRRERPEATDAELLDNLVKHGVSAAVDDSPAMFKAGKRDLDTIVRETRMPDFFVTLTMNETGAHCSTEYKAIDEFMKAWGDGFTWRDAPIECNRAFVSRFEHILEHYLLGGPRVLGDIEDYAIRYECQGRGSLHVHMILWLRTDADVADVDSRIIAYVPADYDDDLDAWIPPADPLQLRLFRHAYHKQQHKCRDPTVCSLCSVAICSHSPPRFPPLVPLASPLLSFELLGLISLAFLLLFFGSASLSLVPTGRSPMCLQAVSLFWQLPLASPLLSFELLGLISLAFLLLFFGPASLSRAHRARRGMCLQAVSLFWQLPAFCRSLPLASVPPFPPLSVFRCQPPAAGLSRYLCAAFLHSSACICSPRARAASKTGAAGCTSRSHCTPRPSPCCATACGGTSTPATASATGTPSPGSPSSLCCSTRTSTSSRSSPRSGRRTCSSTRRRTTPPGTCTSQTMRRSDSASRALTTTSVSLRSDSRRRMCTSQASSPSSPWTSPPSARRAPCSSSTLGRLRSAVCASNAVFRTPPRSRTPKPGLNSGPPTSCVARFCAASSAGHSTATSPRSPRRN